MSTLSYPKSLSYRRLITYRVIDPTGLMVGKIVDATLGNRRCFESVSVFLFGTGRTIRLAWQDLVVSSEKQTVMVLPEWGTTVP